MLHGERDKTPEGIEIFKPAKATPAFKRKVDDAADWLNEMMNPDFAENLGYRGRFTFSAERLDRKQRAYAEKGSIHLGSSDSTKVAIHELGHALEQKDFEIRKMAQNFRIARTKDDKTVRLKDLEPGAGYDATEKTKVDKFISNYTGKEYGHDTEITSMGLQHLFEDPFEFARRDIGHFQYTLNVLRYSGKKDVTPELPAFRVAKVSPKPPPPKPEPKPNLAEEVVSGVLPKQGLVNALDIEENAFVRQAAEELFPGKKTDNSIAFR